ncbi:hypothetical protein PMKS-002980 [Pichia membranifaciens]|uniref:Cysteine protease n=1 Tax=Pichia membranifaciens TaxID=4926 RepID=A0A1Q2YIV0_9ASCO|nr:hypothetical protein PMKS-002980 [Pichia membranifaciens]
METSQELESRSGHSLYDVLDYIWEMPSMSERCSSEDLVILGKTYSILPKKEGNKDSNDLSEVKQESEVQPGTENAVIVEELKQGTDNSSRANGKESDTPLNNIRAFLSRISNTTFDASGYETVRSNILPLDCPQEFLDDLYTRLWFTYRSGFPIIERDKNGPSPLSIGSILRGTLDMNNLGKGFTTDSGWGCMIRTSQSLLANALIALKLGRDWQFSSSSPEDLEQHWEIVEQFADVSEAAYSIQNYVLYAAKYCGKRPGEWFGPSNAAKSIQKLCEEKPSVSNLKVYISTDSGDIFEDEILKLSAESDTESFTPILLLCGVRLGVQNINPLYWEFLKYLLQLPYSVGISGGRPSSSHYFFGYQSDYLFYLDPHVPQNAILLDDSGHLNDKARKKILETIHSKKLRKLYIGKIDPSMLIGFLIKSKSEYDDFKQKINAFDCTKKFLSIHESRPQIVASLSSAGSELDGFIDLGVESINEDGEEYEHDVENENMHEHEIANKVENATHRAKEESNRADTEEWKEEMQNLKRTPDIGVIKGIKEEAMMKVNNDYAVDAFDLDCDPSQETDRSGTAQDTQAIAEESLVVVSGNDPIDLVVVENPDVEEH